jgi:hypothetical protein
VDQLGSLGFDENWRILCSGSWKERACLPSENRYARPAGRREGREFIVEQ